MTTVKKSAFAKINLHLDITGIMPDGYHSVNNIMQSVSLCDTVTLIPRDDGEYTVSCNVEGVPTDRSNLVVRAAVAFEGATGLRVGADIVIDKSIPMQAGLAGGSADAAATLLSINEMCGSPLGIKDLCELGGRLGADVPFCIVGGTAFAEGKGDILKKLPDMPQCTVVVACGGEGVSTPKAFAMLDEQYNRFSSEIFYAPRQLSAINQALSSGSITDLASNIYNIFEQPILAIRPVASNLRRIMLSSGALGAMMSGSGPSVFGIFDNVEKARAACDTIKKIGVTPHICHPVNSLS